MVRLKLLCAQTEVETFWNGYQLLRFGFANFNLYYTSYYIRVRQSSNYIYFVLTTVVSERSKTATLSILDEFLPIWDHPSIAWYVPLLLAHSADISDKKWELAFTVLNHLAHLNVKSDGVSDLARRIEAGL